MTRLLIIDADDGPEGGGAAALGRIARRSGIEYEFVAFEAIASGYDELAEGGRPLLLDQDQLAARLHESPDSEIVVPTSPRSLRLLRAMAAEGEGLSESLVELIRARRFPDFGAENLPTMFADGSDDDDDQDDEGAAVGIESLGAVHRVFWLAPGHAEALVTLGPGLLVAPSDRLQFVLDAEDAWFKLRAHERSGDWPVAYYPLLGRSLHVATGYLHRGKLRAGAVLRVDAGRESWRPALGHSVADKVWDLALSGLARAFDHCGFFESVWLYGTHSKRPELVAIRPLPAPWIDLAAEQVASALAGRVGGMLPAGHFHADIPIDRALSPQDLVRRSLRS